MQYPRVGQRPKPCMFVQPHCSPKANIRLIRSQRRGARPSSSTSTIINHHSSIRPSRCAVRLRMVKGTKARGIGFQPVRLEQQKDGNHEHLRINVMKTVTGWKPIPREQNACSTPKVGQRPKPCMFVQPHCSPKANLRLRRSQRRGIYLAPLGS